MIVLSSLTIRNHYIDYTKKEGSFFDLPIAIGILLNFEDIKKQNLEDTVFIGELSLDGKLNHINGVSLPS